MKLTWTTILYNEEESIRQAAQSIIPIIDEAVIGIDKKTNDKTEEILKEIFKDHNKPLHLIPFKFKNNYSEARNKVLERVGTSHVIVMDGDEFMESDSYQYFDRYLKTRRLVSGIITTQYGEDLQSLQVTKAPTLRIFDSRYRYRFRVHEEPVIKNPNLMYEEPNIVMRNIKTKKQRATKSRDFRIVQILKDLNDYPNESQIKFNLALEYMESGKYEKALEHLMEVQQKLAHSQQYYARFCIGNIMTKTGNYIAAHKHFRAMIPVYPHRNEHLIMMGTIHIELKEYFEAFNYLFSAANMAKPNTMEMGHEHFYRWMPWWLLWKCFKAINYKEGVLKCEQIILENFPEAKEKLDEKI